MNLAPYDPDRLWLKARLFINRALEGREFEESAFWASAALELLAKAALSNISPLLIANPNDDGKSFMIASGVTEDRGGFSSVQAKALWSRCQRAFKPFSELEAAKISAARNDYLHAAGVGFDKLPADQWWAKYWAQATVLISHLDKEIDDFVGPARASQVRGYLRRNEEHLTARLEALLERARHRLAQHENETMSARLQREWNAFSVAYARHHTDADCPACSSNGQLEGEETIERRVEGGSSYDEDEGYWDDRTLWLVIGTDRFECPTCHLVLDDYELVLAAGLPDSFEVVGDLDDYYEPEYNNE